MRKRKNPIQKKDGEKKAVGRGDQKSKKKEIACNEILVIYTNT